MKLFKKWSFCKGPPLKAKKFQFYMLLLLGHPVGGPGIIVEIDESKFGKVKNHKGHKVDGVWILGGVEKTPERRVFVQIVDSRDQVTLIGLIKQHVHPGSIVRTDLWKGYKNLTREMDVIHETVNHTLFFKDPVTQVHTNTIEGTWAGIKVNISASQRTKKYIKGHLGTFLWRRENSGNIWEAFMGLLNFHLNNKLFEYLPIL